MRQWLHEKATTVDGVQWLGPMPRSTGLHQTTNYLRRTIRLPQLAGPMAWLARARTGAAVLGHRAAAAGRIDEQYATRCIACGAQAVDTIVHLTAVCPAYTAARTATVETLWQAFAAVMQRQAEEAAAAEAAEAAAAALAAAAAAAAAASEGGDGADAGGEAASDADSDGGEGDASESGSEASGKQPDSDHGEGDGSDAASADGSARSAHSGASSSSSEYESDSDADAGEPARRKYVVPLQAVGLPVARDETTFTQLALGAACLYRLVRGKTLMWAPKFAERRRARADAPGPPVADAAGQAPGAPYDGHQQPAAGDPPHPHPLPGAVALGQQQQAVALAGGQLPGDGLMGAGVGAGAGGGHGHGAADADDAAAAGHAVAQVQAQVQAQAQVQGRGPVSGCEIAAAFYQAVLSKHGKLVRAEERRRAAAAEAEGDG